MITLAITLCNNSIDTIACKQLEGVRWTGHRRDPCPEQLTDSWRSPQGTKYETHMIKEAQVFWGGRECGREGGTERIVQRGHCPLLKGNQARLGGKKGHFRQRRGGEEVGWKWRSELSLCSFVQPKAWGGACCRETVSRLKSVPSWISEVCVQAHTVLYFQMLCLKTPWRKNSLLHCRCCKGCADGHVARLQQRKAGFHKAMWEEAAEVAAASAGLRSLTGDMDEEAHGPMSRWIWQKHTDGSEWHQASKKFQQSIQLRGLHSMVTLGTEGRGKKIQYLKINPIRGIIGRETKRLQTHGKEEWWQHKRKQGWGMN